MIGIVLMISDILENCELFHIDGLINNPEICIGLIIDKGGTPISCFGISDTLDASLLSGITHAVNSFSNHLSQSIPGFLSNNENKIHENYLNMGLYFTHFKNLYDEIHYGIIFRPLQNFFASSWIKKVLAGIIEKLKNSKDVVDSSMILFRTFNCILLNEFELIDKINVLTHFEKNKCILIFRESGVSYGNINNVNVRNILNFIISDLETTIDMKFHTSDNVFCIKRIKIDGEDYFTIETQI